MWLGPSTKMTTLYHFNCPIVKEMYLHSDVEIPGVVVAGISENYQEKLAVAQQVGILVEQLQAEGAIVVTDGWGNHHIDFVSVIEEIEKRGLPTVGLSFFGLQGRSVCTNEYLNTLIDFNKGTTGYESCKVGENYLSSLDAHKAVAILKNKIEKCKVHNKKTMNHLLKNKLVKKYFEIHSIRFGKKTKIENETLIIAEQIPDISSFSQCIKQVNITIIDPQKHDPIVNSNLDFFPIAYKSEGLLGEGITYILDGVVVMITGVDEVGIQPANVGSSEGLLSKHVVFDTPGTPKKTDKIIAIDLLFQKGASKSKEGVRSAHEVADKMIETIRIEMKKLNNKAKKMDTYQEKSITKPKRIALVKMVSGLGNMYETVLFPKQPGGYIGSYSTMTVSNRPIVVSANQIMDGVIHSLL